MPGEMMSWRFCTLFLAVACGGGSDGDKASEDASTSGHTNDAAARDASTRPRTDAAASDAGVASTSDTASFGSAKVVDCTAKGQSECIAARALRSGMSLSCRGTIEDVAEFLIGTPSWTISCYSDDSEFAMQLEFPTQKAGPLSLTATPGAPGKLKFYVEANDLAAGNEVGSMTESSDNLKSGKLVGTVGNDNTLVGTLTAFWDAPSADCASGDGSNPCQPGALEVTFNVTAPGGGDTSGLGTTQSCSYADGCLEFRMHTTSCYASDKANCEGPLFDGSYVAGSCPAKTWSSSSVDQTSCGQTATFLN